MGELWRERDYSAHSLLVCRNGGGKKKDNTFVIAVTVWREPEHVLTPRRISRHLFLQKSEMMYEKS